MPSIMVTDDVKITKLTAWSMNKAQTLIVFPKNCYLIKVLLFLFLSLGFLIVYLIF